MKNPNPPTFHPRQPGSTGVLSWVHIGDLHMTNEGEQNHLDLEEIVDQINAVFAESVSFVYLPGDIADDGSRRAYAIVRKAMDRLQAPWCAILGDHDVHEKSFDNFLHFMGRETHYAFTVAGVHFLALNAFDIPDPGSFAILPEQMQWIEAELKSASESNLEKVILLHCYPSDLKQGREELTHLLVKHNVRLVDMGHTHYNEISNDGKTLYTATRSTGQIEEGPVGFSITSLDGGVVSWRFTEPGKLPFVMITSPGDERLLPDNHKPANHSQQLRLRAMVWSCAEVQTVEAVLGWKRQEMQRQGDSILWETIIDTQEMNTGTHTLRVDALDSHGNAGADVIQVVIPVAGSKPPRTKRASRDQDNALEAWPEHGLLGTRLGPNKNGRKW